MNCLKNSCEKRLKMPLNSGMVRNAPQRQKIENASHIRDVKKSLIKTNILL